jgi:hypothetical protein
MPVVSDGFHKFFLVETIMESPILGWLVVAAFGLLLSVTLGVVYITTSEWRDRRRRENESRR